MPEGGAASLPSSVLRTRRRFLTSAVVLAATVALPLAACAKKSNSSLGVDVPAISPATSASPSWAPPSATPPGAPVTVTATVTKTKAPVKTAKPAKPTATKTKATPAPTPPPLTLVFDDSLEYHDCWAGLSSNGTDVVIEGQFEVVEGQAAGPAQVAVSVTNSENSSTATVEATPGQVFAAKQDIGAKTHFTSASTVTLTAVISEPGDTGPMNNLAGFSMTLADLNALSSSLMVLESCNLIVT